ncbi:MAG: PQQ-like beta-propeller repeat protein [Spirochaetes bacterium]|nr:PQQ-like beta-propeller repeat protein [Spirochaetota bacterium]
MLKKLSYLSFTLLFLHLALSAVDWPKWGGPSGNFTTTERLTQYHKITTSSIVWQKNVGRGYSSVTVVNNRVYTMGYSSRNDTIYCFDLVSGREIWSYSYPSSTGSYQGTRATPVIDGNRLYTLSRYGIVTCLDITNGKKIWQIDIAKQHGAKASGWGFSSSAVIEGNLVVFNVNQNGIALNKNNGQLVWKSSRMDSGYASPVVFTLKGKRVGAFFNSRALILVDIANGKKIWEYPWITAHDVNAADPLVFDNKIFITSNYGKGCTLLDISSGKPNVLWRNTTIKSHFSSPVYHQGYIYGTSDDANASRGEVICLNASNGKVTWKSNQIGVNALILAGNDLLIINEKGVFYVMAANPSAHQTKYQSPPLLSQLCWTQPVYSNGYLLLRNDRGTLICIKTS